MKKKTDKIDQSYLGTERDQLETIKRAQQPNVGVQKEIAETTPIIDGKD